MLGCLPVVHVGPIHVPVLCERVYACTFSLCRPVPACAFVSG